MLSDILMQEEKNMERIFNNVIVLCMILLFFVCLTACNNIGSTENVVNQKYEPTFEVTVDELLTSLKNLGYSVIEKDITEFEKYNEKHLKGIIKLNEHDELQITIMSSQNDVFRVNTKFVITNYTVSAEKLPNVYEVILKTLKPNIPSDFHTTLNKNSNEYYSNDFENLRMSLTYEDSNNDSRVIVDSIVVCINPTETY